MNLVNNQDNPDNRKKLAQKEAEKIQKGLVIPASLSASVYEGFEPLTVSADILDTHIIKLINLVLDHDEESESEDDFNDKLGDWNLRFLGEWIDELQDGLVNGQQDALLFF